MQVKKRDGSLEPVHFDKIQHRIKKMSAGLNKLVDPATVALKTIDGLYDGVSTTALDNLAAEISATMLTQHPDYAILAGRISVSNLHKNTTDSLYTYAHDMYNWVNPKTGKHSPLITKTLFDVYVANIEALEDIIDYERDFGYDYFGFKTLERAYLLKIDGKIYERPQHMLLRVCVGIHGYDLHAVKEMYDLMSLRYMTHATPTLFNSGTNFPQMSSCFLLTMADDSIQGIYKTLSQTAVISQRAGGIGLSITDIRASGSYIAGTNGTSNGIVPMLKVFNDTAKYVDQGGGKRKGSFAIYLEPWHGDVFEFLDLKKNTGAEDLRARDLFYAMWIPNMFMRRVESNEMWSLMCPHSCPGLTDSYGEEFDALYTKYENEGKFIRQVKARDLWTKILDNQIETGTPYMLYKDHINEKSQQKNIGPIRSSNLCTEIVEHTSPDEIAVCNLASIALPMFVNDGAFDFKELYRVTKITTTNLNKVIDVNYYPTPETEVSNNRHRPIGIGVQGLADVFQLLKLPFDSDEAKQLNKDIFEVIYYAAVEQSIELAAKAEAIYKRKPYYVVNDDSECYIGAYSTFYGSPAANGQLQYDLWGATVNEQLKNIGNLDVCWQTIKSKLKLYGMRNSLLVAPMPTASTSQILGNNECFEPYTTNMYVRRVIGGEFMIVNKHLLNDLIDAGLWNEQMRQELMRTNGSIQQIPGLPKWMYDVYKTVWEISMKDIMQMSADRGQFIDQSQSLNLFVKDANINKLTAIHFYGWKLGLKTGMYYLRTPSAKDPIKFTVDDSKKAVVETAISTDDYAAMIAQAKNAAANEDEDCIMCGS